MTLYVCNPCVAMHVFGIGYKCMVCGRSLPPPLGVFEPISENVRLARKILQGESAADHIFKPTPDEIAVGAALDEAEKRGRNAGYIEGYEAAMKGAAAEITVALGAVEAEINQFQKRISSSWFYRDERFGDYHPTPPENIVERNRR